MQVTPYLSFEGRAEEAIGFYREVLGAEVAMLMRWRDNPEGCPQGMAPDPEKVMHAHLTIGGTHMLLSDGRCSGKPAFQGISLALNAADPQEAERVFGALSQGGEVTMPLGKTFFSRSFGMLTDKFGVSWMVVVESSS